MMPVARTEVHNYVCDWQCADCGATGQFETNADAWRAMHEAEMSHEKESGGRCDSQRARIFPKVKEVYQTDAP